jgi:hypothetical protein
MFPELTYRQQVEQEMQMFRAKLLSIIGLMNARGVLSPTSEMMETIMNTQRAILDGWKRGDMIQVTVSMFDVGRFRDERLEDVWNVDISDTPPPVDGDKDHPF